MDPKGVIDKILSDAQAQADEIKAQASKEEGDKQAKHQQELSEFKKQSQEIAEKTAEERKSRILAAARMNIAKQILAQKREILEQVFTEAQSKIKDMPDDVYKDMMKSLMTQAVETGDEQVVVDKNETVIEQGFINDINQQLNKDGKGNLKLSDEKQDIGSGFILKRENISCNVSGDVLIKQTRKDLEIEIAKELFTD